MSRYSFISQGRIKAGKKLQRILKRKSIAAKRINAIRKAYKNPSYHKKLSIFRKNFYRNIEKRNEIDKIITAWWREHPNLKEEYRKRAKAYFIKNPDKFKKFLKAGKNASVLKYRTKQGFIVRSRGEKAIADFLFKNKIKALYESHTLIRDGQLCTPDFYLIKYKTFIEFYGGHPGSWKKKVMKNRLYKKYKIRCIFITPAELRNLNYYLIYEARRMKR